MRKIIPYGAKEINAKPVRNESESLGLIDQTMMDCIKGELKPIGYTKFVEDVVQMVFNRLFADK